jgi:hypothetical protein
MYHTPAFLCFSYDITHFLLDYTVKQKLTEIFTQLKLPAFIYTTDWIIVKILVDAYGKEKTMHIGSEQIWFNTQYQNKFKDHTFC